MTILDVQAMVKRPQEELENKYSLPLRSQNSMEKRSTFAQQLKKLSQRKVDSSANKLQKTELPDKDNYGEKPDYQQKKDLVDPGETVNRTPVQDKQITPPQSDGESRDSSEKKEPISASPEADSAQGTYQQPQNQEAVAQMNTVIAGLVQMPVHEPVQESVQEPVQILEANKIPEAIIDSVSNKTTESPLVVISESASVSATDMQTKGQAESALPVAVLPETSQTLGAESVIPNSDNNTSQRAGTGEQIKDQELGKVLPVNEGSSEVQPQIVGEADPDNSNSSKKETTKAELSTQQNTSQPNPQDTPLISGGNTVIPDTKVSTPQPVLASQAAENVLTGTQNAPAPETAQNTVLVTEGTASSQNEANGNKKSDKAGEKSRISSSLMEKTLLNQTGKKPEEPANNNIKKIIDFESHRVTAKKAPSELIGQDDTTQNKNADTQLQSVTILDKNLIEVSKTGLNLGKAVVENPNQSAANPQEIVDQIVKNVELLDKQTGSEMKIQLKPEFLGKMTIKIAIEAGMVTARFFTENQHVKHVLEANMNTLKQTLEANGLKVERTEVNVQLDNGGNFNGSEGNHQQLWQEMTSQGRNTAYYSSWNEGMSGEFEELATYQREVDQPQIMNEGRVDFTI